MLVKKTAPGLAILVQEPVSWAVWDLRLVNKADVVSNGGSVLNNGGEILRKKVGKLLTELLIQPLQLLLILPLLPLLLLLRHKLRYPPQHHRLVPFQLLPPVFLSFRSWHARAGFC
jgi:hypothetical protein